MNAKSREIVQKFADNHREFWDRVCKLPAPIGAQLFLAGQQVEREAHYEVMGEAYGAIYTTFIHSVGFSPALIENARETVSPEYLGLLEKFKAGYKSILETVKDIPFAEDIAITRDTLQVEEILADKHRGERRYKVVRVPISDDGTVSFEDSGKVIGYQDGYVIRLIAVPEVEI